MNTLLNYVETSATARADALPDRSKDVVQPRSTLTQLSEHGHSISRIRPITRHSGESVTTFYNGLFTTVIGISTLGASITFNYVIGNNNVPPAKHTFDLNDVQLFLGLSWLFFLLALAFASLGSTVLTFFKDHWREDWDGFNGKTSQTEVQLYAALETALLSALVVTAFIFLCLVVTAYSPIIGWISLGFTAVFGLGIFLSVFYGFPWPGRVNTPRPGRAATH